MSEEHLGLGGQEKLRDTDPENPRTAADVVSAILGPRTREVDAGFDEYVELVDAYARQQVEAALDHAVAIQRKCEQYWNEHGVSDAEYHAALGFIYQEAAAIRALKSTA